jgi:hypothetical protein
VAEISVVKRIERAAEVKISQKCFQLRLADSENFKLTATLRNLKIDFRKGSWCIWLILFVISHCMMAGSAALDTIPICQSPLFLFWSLYLHLKNVMENLNYVFFLAICKEGARNYFLLPADMHYASVACRNCAGETEYTTS